MKKIIFLLSFISSSMFALSQSGVIYNFAFRIDDALVTQMKTQNKEYKILNLATIEDLPKELSDTILLVTEQILGKHLNASLTSMRPEEKLLMGALPEHLLYLPGNTFKKAVQINDNLNYYVNITCHIAASGGVRITFANNSVSKVKPKLSLSIKILDKEKNLIEEKDVVLKDFEKLRSKTFEDTYGIRGLKQNTDVVTVSETIDANDVLRMYVMALVEVFKEP
jgi:hypothetical protein